MRVIAVAVLLAATIGTGVAQAAPELPITERLQDRRYAAASERTRIIGFQDGRFYANGWHIAGEMGGVWSEPIKLVDGVWFGIDGEWVDRATEFRSGWGYVEMDLPTTAGPTRPRSTTERCCSESRARCPIRTRHRTTTRRSSPPTVRPPRPRSTRP